MDYISPNTITQSETCEFSLDGFSWTKSVDEETGETTVLCWNETTDGIRFRYYLPEGVTTITDIKKLEPFKNSK